MRGIFNINPVMRAVGVIGAVSVLATSVTYAALQSEATLAANTAESDTLGLVIDSNNDSNFASSEAGFAFTGIIPGTTASTEGAFSLRNNGESTLDVKVRVTGTPLVTPSTTDTTKVHFMFTPTGGSAVDLTLAQLQTPEGGELLKNFAIDAAGSADYTVKVSVEANAFVGESFSISSFNLVFSGTPVTTP